jgi:hypothetical protein
MGVGTGIVGGRVWVVGGYGWLWGVGRFWEGGGYVRVCWGRFREGRGWRVDGVCEGLGGGGGGLVNGGMRVAWLREG